MEAARPRPAGGPQPARRRFDLLALPGIGPLLKRRGTRTFVRLLLLAGAGGLVLHGLTGPDLAPKNLATVVTWVHYRGLLVLGLLLAGNLFCAACPFMLVRDWARRVARPVRNWPRRLRSKWPGIALFAAVLFCYELFDLWGSPFWTAWLIVGYFAAALAVDCLFRHASFCKYVCPLGQFNFVASTLSPLEVSVRDPEVCRRCETRDCIRGRRDPDNPFRVIQRGCELALFQPRKVGNLDCTFCLDCVYACPHDNIGIQGRMPGAEWFDDPVRSGMGRLSRRADLAALVTVFTFGALLNAFAMVSPVYAVERWLAALLNTRSEVPVLGLLFAALLVVEPVLLIGAATWATRVIAGHREALFPLAVKLVYCVAPLGFGIWLAHYTFHFLTGVWTVIPVAQHALAQAGLPLLGEPAWGLGGLTERQVQPFEIGFLALGLMGSLAVLGRICRREFPQRPALAALPWGLLCAALTGAAVWLMFQPMEMRGTFLG